MVFGEEYKGMLNRILDIFQGNSVADLRSRASIELWSKARIPFGQSPVG